MELGELLLEQGLQGGDLVRREGRCLGVHDTVPEQGQGFGLQVVGDNARQVLDAARRVHEVGGQHGVERQPPEREAAAVQQQGGPLEIMTHLWDVRGLEYGLEGDEQVVDVLRRAGQDGGPAAGRQGEPEQGGAQPGARPRDGLNDDLAGALQLRRERLDGAGGGDEVVLGAGSLLRALQPLQQGAEVEAAESLAEPFHIRWAESQLLRVELNRQLADDDGELFGAARDIGVGGKGGGGARGLEVVEMREDLLKRAEARDEFGRRLLADAWDARDVVAGIAPEGAEIGELAGAEAVSLLDGLFVVHLCVGDAAPGDHDGDAVGDELEFVEVARHDQHSLSRALGLGRQGADDVVGLIALLAVRGDVHRLQYLASHVELGGELVGHGPPGGLVVLEDLVAEGGPGEVEGDADHLRPLFVEDLEEHGGEAIGRVGNLAGRVGEGREREEGAIEQAVAVDEDEFGAGGLFCGVLLAHLSSERAPRPAGGAGWSAPPASRAAKSS